MYLDFLENDLPDLLDGVLTRHQQEELIFMHDGAGPHYSLIVREHLDKTYQNWIGKGGNIAWPARSPDLNPLDFFYWGYCKDTIYRGNTVENVEDLRLRIQNFADAVEPNKILNATQSVIGRVRKCIKQEGGIFEHL